MGREITRIIAAAGVPVLLEDVEQGFVHEQLDDLVTEEARMPTVSHRAGFDTAIARVESEGLLTAFSSAAARDDFGAFRERRTPAFKGS